MTKKEIQQVLQERGLRPLKQFGQNFLYDQNLCAWLVERSTQGLLSGQAVVEIGPGLGALTEGLLARGLHVTALEKDRGLVAWLREKFSVALTEGRLFLHEGDALEIGPTLSAELVEVVGNLPYNVATPLLMSWMERSTPPRRMFFLLQRELGQRVAASPGTKAYGALSVLVQAEYTVTMVRTVPPTVFYPQPEVESAAVELVRRSGVAWAPEERKKFRETVKAGFAQRRKKLSSLLAVDEPRRAEELNVEEWRRLATQISADG